MVIRKVGLLFKDAGVKFWDDKGQRLGAALAFYTALSLSPLLVAAVAVAGMIFGQAAARGELVDQIRDAVGKEGATVIEQLIVQSAVSSQGIVATVLAIVVVLWGASSVFAELQDALNTIWKAPARKSSGTILQLLRERLLAFSLVAGTALLLLTSLVVSAILSAVSSRAAEWTDGTEWFIQIANFLVTFALMTALFAMIFRWLPEVGLAWRDVWLGAATTAALFSIGKYLIGLYLARAAIGSPFGAAGAFVILLVWIYYSSQILLFGAELTYVYAKQFGRETGWGVAQ